MLYREESLFVLRSTQNTKIRCGQNGSLLNVKSGGTYIGHWAVRGLLNIRHEYICWHGGSAVVCQVMKSRRTQLYIIIAILWMKCLKKTAWRFERTDWLQGTELFLFDGVVCSGRMSSVKLLLRDAVIAGRRDICIGHLSKSGPAPLCSGQLPHWMKRGYPNFAH
jgi:hypothetical protein